MGAAQKHPVVVVDDMLRDEVSGAVIEVFKSSFGINVKLASFSRIERYALVGDVSAMVGMVQHATDGNLAISFLLPVISRILSKLYQSEFPSVNADVREGTAELANMIYGRLKLKMNARGYDFQMSLPSVITGPGHSVYHDPGEVAVLHFIFDEKFKFEVVISCHGR